MNRIEKRLTRVAEQLARLDERERLVRAELGMLQHLDDDARLDAAVIDSPIERDNARIIGSDVDRFTRLLDGIADERSALEAKRLKLMMKL